METKVYELKAHKLTQLLNEHEEAHLQREHAEANAPKPGDRDAALDDGWNDEDDIPHNHSDARIEEGNDCFLVPKRRYIGAVEHMTMRKARDMIPAKALHDNVKTNPAVSYVDPDMPVLVVHKRCGGFDVYLFGIGQGERVLTFTPKKESPSTSSGQGENHGREK